MNDIVRRTLEKEASLRGISGRSQDIVNLSLSQEKEEMKRISREIFSDSPPLALLSFDVDRIKDYVFATSRPLEVKGGSDILKSITDVGAPDGLYKWLSSLGIEEKNVIFAGGGSGLILLPASQAEDAKRAIEEGYRKETISATCTAVYELFHPHELIYGKDINTTLQECGGRYFDKGYIERYKSGKRMAFGKIVKLLSFKLRRRKEEKALEELSTFFVPGFLKRCTSCGIYPAVEQDPFIKEDYLCNACYHKREVARKGRGNEALSLEEIVRINKKEEDDLALIYADLCKTGYLLEKAETMEDLSALSKALLEVMEKTKEEIVVRYKLDGRYQAPVVGGDDIVLLIPARYTVDVVRDLCERWKANLQREGAKLEVSEEVKKGFQRLRVSVGFIVAPHTFPIHYLFQYAQALLRNAKKHYYREGKEVDWIDFLVLKAGSPLNIDIEDLRKQEREREYNSSIYHLTRCPYNGDEFKKLCENLEAIIQGGIPSAQLYTILRLLDDHPFPAWINIVYQLIRNKKQWQKAMAKILGTTGEPDYEKWANFFLFKDDNDYYTSFIDLMDLYKISRRGGS